MPDPRDALLEAGFADYIQALGALSEFRAEVARRSALAVARAWPGLKPWPSFEPASLNHGLTWGAWLGVRWEHGGMKVWAGLQWITDERWYAHAGVTPAAEGDRAEVAGWLRTLAPRLRRGRCADPDDG